MKYHNIVTTIIRLRSSTVATNQEDLCINAVMHKAKMKMSDEDEECVNLSLRFYLSLSSW